MGIFEFVGKIFGRKGAKKDGKVTVKRDDLKRSLISELEKMDEVAKKNPKVASRDLYKFVHSSFGQLLRTRYKLTLDEMQAEIMKRKMNRNEKEKFVSLLRQISEFEYGSEGMTKQDFLIVSSGIKEMIRKL